MLKVRLKIRDAKPYVNKDGETITPREIKFKDLGLEQFIVVKKLYQTVEPKIYDKKDGSGKCTIIKTTVEYEDERVNVTISPKALEKWNSLPLGDVSVVKLELVSKLGSYNVYEFTEGTLQDDSKSNLPF